MFFFMEAITSNLRKISDETFLELRQISSRILPYAFKKCSLSPNENIQHNKADQCLLVKSYYSCW